MTHNETVNGLKQLGFFTGWVISGEEITLWENTEPQPTEAQLLEASKLWAATLSKQEADKSASRNALLDRLGITEEEAKLLLGQ
jgi:hypothetical protein